MWRLTPSTSQLGTHVCPSPVAVHVRAEHGVSLPGVGVLQRALAADEDERLVEYPEYGEIMTRSGEYTDDTDKAA